MSKPDENSTTKAQRHEGIYILFVALQSVLLQPGVFPGFADLVSLCLGGRLGFWFQVIESKQSHNSQQVYVCSANGLRQTERTSGKKINGLLRLAVQIESGGVIIMSRTPGYRSGLLHRLRSLHPGLSRSIPDGRRRPMSEGHDHGEAIVHDPTGAPEDKIETAMDNCPAACIYWA